MRVHLTGNATADNFAKSLLKIGNGDTFLGDPNGSITISRIANKIGTKQDLISAVFGELRAHMNDLEWLCERSILAPKNDNVDAINKGLLMLLPGEVNKSMSVDTVTVEDDAVDYPIEFLNSLNPPGLPPHTLELKIGAPIMLIRNLSQPNLCNGTRLVAKCMFPHLIEAAIITGNAVGQVVLLPRIPLMPSNLPFQFKRLHFPIRLCFAMTINKAQAQTLKVVGLNMETPCFNHGQLYVGCSRIGERNKLFIYSPEEVTANVVYKEAL